MNPQYSEPSLTAPSSGWQGNVATLLLAATFISALFYKQLNPEYLGVAGFGLIAMVTLALWGGRRWRGDLYWLPFVLVAAFWTWWFLSSLWSPVSYVSAGAAWNMAALPATALTGLLLSAHTRFLSQGILLLSLITASLAVYACVQFFAWGERPTATFINRNNFAALQLPIIMLALFWALNEQLPRLIQHLALLLLALLVLVIGLIGSRGVLLVLLAGTALVFIQARREQVPGKRLLTAALVIIMALVAANLAGLGNLGQRVASLSDPQAAGQDRFYILEGSLKMASEAPWYGIGPGLYNLAYPQYRLTEDSSAAFYAHNDYLQFLIEAGWPALVLVALTLISMAWFVWAPLAQRRGNQAQRLQIMTLFAGLAAVAAHSILTFNLYLMPILITIGLLLAQLLVLLCACAQPGKGPLAKPESTTKKRGPGHKLLLAALTLTLLWPANYFASAIGGSWYFNKAMSALNGGETQQGETYLAQAIQWWPQVDLYHYTKAWLLMQRAQSSLGGHRDDRLAEAHAHLDEAQRLNPLRPQPFVVRGLIYQSTETSGHPNQGPIEAAEQQFRQALKLDPFYLQARFLLGRLLLGANRLEEGVEVLEKGIGQHHPTNELSINYYFLTAEMRRIMGNLESHRELMKTVESMRAQAEKNKENTPNELQQPGIL